MRLVTLYIDTRKCRYVLSFVTSQDDTKSRYVKDM